MTAPHDRYRGRAIEPIIGKDLTPLVAGEVDRVYNETDSIGYELAGHAALFQGDYKLLFTEVHWAMGSGICTILSETQARPMILPRHSRRVCKRCCRPISGMRATIKC